MSLDNTNPSDAHKAAATEHKACADLHMKAADCHENKKADEARPIRPMPCKAVSQRTSNQKLPATAQGND
jgi:hypothetical protein